MPVKATLYAGGVGLQLVDDDDEVMGVLVRVSSREDLSRLMAMGNAQTPVYVSAIPLPGQSGERIDPPPSDAALRAENKALREAAEATGRDLGRLQDVIEKSLYGIANVRTGLEDSVSAIPRT